MTVSKYESLKRSNFIGQLPLDGLEMMYEQWLSEPTSVSHDWQVWFEQEHAEHEAAEEITAAISSGIWIRQGGMFLCC